LTKSNKSFKIVVVMSNESFDFGQFERELELYNARTAVTDMVADSWASLRPTNDVLTTSRRFIIAAPNNEAVPVKHEQVTLHPRARALPISGISTVRIRSPYIVRNHEATEETDRTHVFFEVQYRTGLVARFLLTPDSYHNYVDADEIIVTQTPEGNTYAVRPPAEEHHVAEPLPHELEEIYMGPTPPSELETLYTLLDIVTTYEPALQDNFPLNQD
jgi:hypothetical protein